MSVDKLSCQQLKVFESVYRLRQGMLAANELGLPTSTVSRSLNTMREMFDDQLFVRYSNGLLPTARAESIAPTISRLVTDLQKLDSGFATFEPSKSTTKIVIRAYDEFSFPVLEVIKNRIKPQAPSMKFDIGIFNYDCTRALETGTVDFAVVYDGYQAKNINFERFSETRDIYILARKDHPLMDVEILSVKELSKHSLIEIDNYQDLLSPLLVDVCMMHELKLPVETYTDSLASAVRLLAESNAITLCCNQFTREFVEHVDNVSYRKLPEALIKKIKAMRNEIRPVGNYVVWGNSNQSPAFEWVKKELLLGLRESWERACEHTPSDK